MRFAALYLRSRLAWRSLLFLSLVAVCSWALTLLLMKGMGYGVDHGGLTLLLLLATLAAACIIGTSIRSPFGDAEIAALPLSVIRLSHLAGLLAFAALTLTAVTLLFDLDGARPEYPLLVLLRNLVGLTGLALLTARLFGAHLSWVVPTAFSFVNLVVVASGGDVFVSLAWHLRPGRDEFSWGIALTLLTAGLALVCIHGTREKAGEVE